MCIRDRHMCREVNLASSSSWMYIAYNHLLIDLIYYPFLISLFLTKRGRKFWFVFTLTPLLMNDRKGEKNLSLYACLNKELCLCIYIFVLQIGEKDFDLCLLHVLSPYLHTYSCASLSYLLFIWYAWVKGELHISSYALHNMCYVS